MEDPKEENMSGIFIEERVFLMKTLRDFLITERTGLPIEDVEILLIGCLSGIILNLNNS